MNYSFWIRDDFTKPSYFLSLFFLRSEKYCSREIFVDFYLLRTGEGKYSERKGHIDAENCKGEVSKRKKKKNNFVCFCLAATKRYSKASKLKKKKNCFLSFLKKGKNGGRKCGGREKLEGRKGPLSTHRL